MSASLIVQRLIGEGEMDDYTAVAVAPVIDAWARRTGEHIHSGGTRRTVNYYWAIPFVCENDFKLEVICGFTVNYIIGDSDGDVFWSGKVFVYKAGGNLGQRLVSPSIDAKVKGADNQRMALAMYGVKQDCIKQIAARAEELAHMHILKADQLALKIVQDTLTKGMSEAVRQAVAEGEMDQYVDTASLPKVIGSLKRFQDSPEEKAAHMRSWIGFNESVKSTCAGCLRSAPAGPGSTTSATATAARRSWRRASP